MAKPKVAGYCLGEAIVFASTAEPNGTRDRHGERPTWISVPRSAFLFAQMSFAHSARVPGAVCRFCRTWLAVPIPSTCAPTRHVSVGLRRAVMAARSPFVWAALAPLAAGTACHVPAHEQRFRSFMD
jgi:hypothetical protein